MEWVAKCMRCGVQIGLPMDGPKPDMFPCGGCGGKVSVFPPERERPTPAKKRKLEIESVQQPVVQAPVVHEPKKPEPRGPHHHPLLEKGHKSRGMEKSLQPAKKPKPPKPPKPPK